SRPGDTGPRLLRDDRHRRRLHERAYRGLGARRAGLTFRLHRLLEVIEMERQRVGAHHLHDLAHVLRRERGLALLPHELRDADVRDDERVRRGLAHHGVRRRERGIAQRGALAANADRDARPLGDAREELVHRDRAAVAAGHARDHERKAERVPEEARREVDRGRVDGRQRVVHEVDVLPPGGDARLDIALGRELQMLALPPGYFLGFAGYLNTPAASSAAYSAASTPTMPRITSSVCSPTSGPGWSGPCEAAERRNGGAISPTTPATWCFAVRQ